MADDKEPKSPVVKPPITASDKPKSAKSAAPKKIGALVVSVVFVAAIGAAAFFGYKYFFGLNSTQAGDREVAALVAQISKSVELPDSIPTLATVTDKSKLAGQSFFDKAENGDKVLIYADAEKAILYRPSSGKVIEVAPIKNIPAGETPESSGQVSGATTEASPTALPQLTSRIALLNGTATGGLTVRMEELIKQKFQATVINRTNANTRSYTQTIVVDVNGTKAAEAQQLATAVGATVAPLPSDEATPSGDLMVIIGSDF